MNLTIKKDYKSPPIGKTVIKGQKLSELKSIYHDAISRIVSSDNNDLLLFNHFGNFTSSKIENTLKIVESLMLDTGEKRQTIKKFYSLLVEILQNISLHAARDRDDQIHAFVAISKKTHSYSLITGNLILKEDSPQLIDKLKELNRLSPEELRKLYIDTLCNEEYSKKGGAGLGLLTVAKRITGKIEFEVFPVDNSFDYIVMNLEMSVL